MSRAFLVVVAFATISFVACGSPSGDGDAPAGAVAADPAPADVDDTGVDPLTTDAADGGGDAADEAPVDSGDVALDVGDEPAPDADATAADADGSGDAGETEDARGADAPELPPGERTISGRAYFFDLALGDFEISHTPEVSGAVVSLYEYPDVSVVAADTGEFELNGLPDGVELTLAIEHPDYFPTLTRTFVLDGEDLTDATFQVLSHGLAGVAAGIVGTDVRDPQTCSMATTVTAISDNMDGIWAVGEPGATTTTEPAIDPEFGPVYFNSSVIPEPALAATTTDGGVVVSGPLEGTYEWFAHKEGCEFHPLRMRCVPGWLTNASPPHGLVVASEPGDEPPPAVVLAGDSWSTGLVGPMREAFDDRGWDDVEIRWEFTANAGSQARGWVANDHPPAIGGPDTSRPRMLDALDVALDGGGAPADMLVLVIGGNDFNRECGDGWGERLGFLQDLALDGIEDDIAELVDHALDGRPGLRVMIVGYDYLHYEFLVAFGLGLDGLDTTSYNEGIIELSRRQRAVAEARPAVLYAHNLGMLQHTYGDTIHPPFSIPNPLTGHPEYAPGVAPAPGPAPDYEPFPGGFYTYPAPLDYMPDGIHPNAEGFRTIIDNALDQVPEAWVAGW